MLHAEYLELLRSQLLLRFELNDFATFLRHNLKLLFMMISLNLDPVIQILQSIYSPVNRAPHRDPVCMLRSLILMACTKTRGITKWVEFTRSQPLLAILTGFDPDDLPGIGTYYDFMKRLIDAPYCKPCVHLVRRSSLNIGLHQRVLTREKVNSEDDLNPIQSQTEVLVNELLPLADQPRPDDFNKILEDLLILLGLAPALDDGLLNGNFVLSGDGSILVSGASHEGKPSCSCRSEGIRKCDHPRSYSSPTATWCYDAHHKCFKFGDRYYHILVTQNGHDFPLLTIMPGGNESDYTLSLKALDRLLKALQENGLDVYISAFCGDGHHDSHAHYRYFMEKEIVPIIPLSKVTKTSKVVLSHRDDLKLDDNGVPLCPADVPMRHHAFNRDKNTHVYSCPVKRPTHRNGEFIYVTHLDECPRNQDCAPDSPLGPFVKIKCEENPRLFPPLPRNSKKFKALMNQRSASERCNFINDTYNLDGAHRNADYGLIRLMLANIAHYGTIRYIEAKRDSSVHDLINQVLGINLSESQPEYLDTG